MSALWTPRTGYACATGSDELLGLWNVHTTTSLEETSPGHWELGC